MNSKLFIIPFLALFLIASVSAIASPSVTTSLLYDSTGSSALTVNNGDFVGVTVSSDSIFEPSMITVVELKNSAGNTVATFVNAFTTSDSYYNHFTFGQSSYVGPGTYTIRSTVTAASGQTTTDSLSLTVLALSPTNHAPVIISSPVTTVNESSPYTYDVDATDADGDIITYSLTQNPGWLSINSTTGLISGTAPAVGVDTQYVVTVRASDGTDFDSQTFTITVLNIVGAPTNTAPVITTSPVLTTNECQVYSYDVNANDAEGNTLVYSLTTNPGWLAINSATGLITGTAPSVNANTAYSVGVTVSDGNGGSVVQSYTINVLNSGTCPIIPPGNTAPVANNQNVITNMNVPVGITLTATDADGNTLTYSIVTSPTNGVISGFNSATGALIYTPNTGYVGPDVFTFRANDGTANSNVATVSITVNPIVSGNVAPVVITTAVTSVNECATYSYDVNATDVNGDTLAYSLTTNPGWLAINSVTGLITGTAPSVAVNTPFAVIVSVSDGTLATTQSYTINVVDGFCPIIPPVNNAPVVISSPVLTVNEGTLYTYDVNATDADGNPLTYSLTTAPAWLSINAATGLITGTAPLVLSNTPFAITVQISDGNGGIITQSYTLTVLDVSSGGGSGGSGGSGSSGGNTVHWLGSNSFDEENYLNQFNAVKPIVLEEETPVVKQGTSWLAKFLFWLFVLILILAVLIIVALLIKSN